MIGHMPAGTCLLGVGTFPVGACNRSTRSARRHDVGPAP